jgi:predicted nucleotide-binding protein
MTARSKIPGAVRLLEDALEERVDVFLGYCGRSKPIAQKVKRFLESLKAKVLDWEMDFIPGRTILEQIEAAAKRSVGGIFLFTKDDDLSDGTSTAIAVPRDNVVFEAGYFIGVKGKRNVLIVRETNSKMPADLGGDIYASLPDRGDKPAEEVSIEPIERTLKAFVEAI